jgi:Putative transmembrane protein (PGPGW)
MQQIRRLGVAIVSLGLVLLGVMMFVAPGPVWLAGLLGLGVLAAEFLWARWLRKGAELVDSAFGRGDISRLAASRERERTWQKPSRRQRRHTSLTVFLGHSAIPDLGP